MDSEFEKLLATSNAFSEDEKAALKDLYPNMAVESKKTIYAALFEEMLERENIRNERDGVLLNILEKENV